MVTYLDLRKITDCYYVSGIIGFQSLCELVSKSTKNNKLKEHPLEKATGLLKRVSGRNRNIGGIGAISQNKMQDIGNSVLIVNGCSGIGTLSDSATKSLVESLNKLAENSKTTILLVRGNGDNPELFESQRFNMSNVIFLKDYTLVLMRYYTILCIGGGLSIDESWRKKMTTDSKKLYFEDEMTKYDSGAIREICKKYDIDVVITQTPTSFVKIGMKKFINSSWTKQDEKLIDKCMEEFNRLDRIHMEILSLYKSEPPAIWLSNDNMQENTTRVGNVVFMSCGRYKLKNVANMAAKYSRTLVIPERDTMPESERIKESESMGLSNGRRVVDWAGRFEDMMVSSGRLDTFYYEPDLVAVDRREVRGNITATIANTPTATAAHTIGVYDVGTTTTATATVNTIITR